MKMLSRLLMILVILLNLITICSAGEISAQETLILFRIRGRVVASDDTPVSSLMMQLNYLSTGINEKGEPYTHEARTTAITDSNGVYMIELNLALTWDNYRLSIQSESLDRFKFNLPVYKNLTELIQNSIRSGDFMITVNWRLTIREKYDAELNEINKYGINSDRGRLIRLSGIPDKITNFSHAGRGEGEIWFYYKDGMAIRFLEGIRNKDFYFKPVIESVIP